ncbi:hypothetical protein SH580_17185 [Coraliomargarita algicola]|uniref:Uncharacterized protein n=1 Tax=Coraliomargarita algicola TaxID=3092156 RepID=A0ABZ0RJA5_9BACT|nr:hypothetical protein [Coraliomargarita sp. J2-16]WPJ95158.1 hypothetical protein SH580_17185 [Coraliomargarita sp. J2-16]
MFICVALPKSQQLSALSAQMSFPHPRAQVTQFIAGPSSRRNSSRAFMEILADLRCMAVRFSGGSLRLEIGVVDWNVLDLIRK